MQRQVTHNRGAPIRRALIIGRRLWAGARARDEGQHPLATPIMSYLAVATPSVNQPPARERAENRSLAIRISALVVSFLWNAVQIAAIAYGLFFVYQLFLRAWTLPNGDVREYYRYAVAFWQKQPQFTHLPVEYPPLTVTVFGVTLLPDLPDHNSVFAYWVGALCIIGYLGFLRFSTREHAWTYVLYLFVGAVGTLLARYDLFPALLTLAALWSAQRHRFAGAYVLLAGGTLLKLYPVVLIPVIIIAQWQYERACPRMRSAKAMARHRSRIARVLTSWRLVATEHIVACLAISSLLIAGVFYVAIQVSPQTALSTFTYASERPLQVESVVASLLWFGTALGFPAHPQFSFFSHNFVGPLDVVLLPLAQVAMVAGCLWTYWWQARGKLHVGEACLAVVCILLVTNKVFSPQYLIWVIPLVATVEGFSVLWLAIFLLTSLDYPILYYSFFSTMKVHYDMSLLVVLALRNGLLVYATLRALLTPASSRTPQPSLPAPPPVWEHLLHPQAWRVPGVGPSQVPQQRQGSFSEERAAPVEAPIAQSYAHAEHWPGGTNS